MPTVEATPIPHAGLVQVDVDARDLGSAFVKLERVLADTGEVTIIRPNTSYVGDYMETSNRQARFFDTDAPTDRTFFYRVTDLAQPEVAWPGVRAADAVSVIDTFTRTVAAGPSWGTPDVGNAWTSAFTATTEALVAGGEGTLSMNVEDALRGQHVDGGTFREDWSIRYRVGVDVAAVTGDNSFQWTYLRMDNPVQNYVAAAVTFRTAGTVGWQLAKSVGGVSSNIGSGLAGFLYNATTGVEVRMQAIGEYVRLKLWPQSDPNEPEAWTAEVRISDVPKNGKAALTAYVPSPNTTALPLVFDFDNVAAFASSGDAEATQYLLSSEGFGWLRDPINPCHSIRLPTCVDVRRCATSTLSFEVGSTAGWETQNGALALSATRFRGQYAGSLTADYATPAAGIGTTLPTTLYTWDATAEGWVGEGATTAARVTTPTPHDGAGMLRAQKVMGAGTEAIRFNDAQGLRNLSANGPTVAVWALVPAGTPGTNWTAHLEAQDPAFTWIPGPDFAMTPGTWRLLTFTPPAGLLANMRSLGLSFSATGVSTTANVYVDTFRQGGQVSARSTVRLPVKAGRAVRASAYLRAPTAIGARVGIAWETTSGQWLSTSAGPFLTLVPGVWTRSTMVAEAPADGVARIVVQQTGTPTAGQQLLFDAAELAYREPASDGVFLASLDELTRAAQSQTVAVVGDSLPVNVSLPRRKPASSMTLVSRSFEDRQALLTLLGEGTPVQLDMPEEYGVPTMTLAVGDISEAQGMSDMRYQPRIHRLPWVQVRPQVGPANGPCGAKYEDWCEDPNLDTWGEVNAAGLTYLSMIDVT